MATASISEVGGASLTPARALLDSLSVHMTQGKSFGSDQETLIVTRAEQLTPADGCLYTSLFERRKHYFNGARWPKKVQQSKAKFYDPPSRAGNIAAIDFGTTSCSVAYYIRAADETYVLKLGQNEERISSRILINSEGRVVAFGRDALKQYAAALDKTDLHYFEGVKMNLQHDKEVHLEYTVKDSNGAEFYLVEVIAMILRHLKEQLLQHNTRGINKLKKATDFDWIITVPALWKPSGKQMMRLAAYNAGLTSSDDPSIVISKLSPVESGYRSDLVGMMINHPNPYKLSLALEPEVAAICCKEEAQKSNPKYAIPKCYMVVDIGGGTVDISALEVNKDGLIEVILPPAGNDCGGTRVNTAFKKYLGELVDDPEFKNFLTDDNPYDVTENKYELDIIINELFEAEKQQFGNKNFESEARIKLPINFMSTYHRKLQDGIRRLHNMHVRIHGNNLYVSSIQMEEFFKPAIEGIKECFTTCMSKVAGKVEAVYLVGGFGGCKYIQSVLQEELDRCKHRTKIFTSARHDLAVVLGAVSYHKNPLVVSSRIADATYGTSCIVDYNSAVHDTEYQIAENGKLKCRDIFFPFVHKGQKLETNVVLQDVFVPIHHKLNGMTFKIFATQKCDLKYTVSPTGEPLKNIEQLGTLIVPMPKTPMPKTDGDKVRQVQLTVDMTQTEIQIQAYDISSKTRVAAAIDFLS